jgi:hypothetical protein
MPSISNEESASVVDALRTELGNSWAFIQPSDSVWRASVSVLAITIFGVWTARLVLGLYWAVTALVYAVAVVFVCSRRFTKAGLVRTERSIAFSFTRCGISWAILVNSLLGLTFVLIAVRFLVGNAFSGNPEIGVGLDLVGAIAIVLMIPVTPVLCGVPALHSLRTTLEVTVDSQKEPRVQVTLLLCSGSSPKPDQAEESKLVDSIQKVFSSLYQ